jgi:hypothetical protein
MIEANNSLKIRTFGFIFLQFLLFSEFYGWITFLFTPPICHFYAFFQNIIFLFFSFLIIFPFKQSLFITNLVLKIFDHFNNKTFLRFFVLLLSFIHCLLYIIQGKRVEKFGGHISYIFIFLYFLTAIIIFLKLKKNKKITPQNILFITLLLGIFIRIIQIESFPLTEYTADLLPLIQKGIRNLLTIESPYAIYQIKENFLGIKTYPLPLTYLPGLWLFYVPFEILKIDYRYATMLADILSLLILYKIGLKKDKNEFNTSLLNILFPCFFLMPYLIFQHDIYNNFVWLYFLITLYLLYNKKFLFVSISWGLFLSARQWSWILSPILFIYFYKKTNLRKTILYSFISIVIGSSILLPFIIWAPTEFYHGVIKHFI